MNWLSMMSQEDKIAIVKELAQLVSAESSLKSGFETLVDAAFARHGLRPGGNAVTVVQGILSDQDARQAAQRQRDALQVLINNAKLISKEAVNKESVKVAIRPELHNAFDLSVAAVEREFKL